MHGRNYDVLLLRPQDITDVIDIEQAIDLVEQGYREAQGFPIINAPRRRVHSKNNVRSRAFPAASTASASSARSHAESRSPTIPRARNIPIASIRYISFGMRRPHGCNAS